MTPASVVIACLLMTAVIYPSINMQAYGDYVIPSCQNSAIVATNPIIKSNHSTLGGVVTGDQIIISSTLADKCGMDHPAIAIIETRDSKGVTMFLAWQNFTMQANSQTEVGLFWVPDKAGEYQLRVFTLVSLDAFGFGRVATSKIDIAESRNTIIVIPNDPDQQSNFEPSAIKVVLGMNSTVTFVNQDGVSHRLVVEHNSADQVAFQKYVFVPSHDSFVYNFTDTGGFWYSDRDMSWMRGYVEVHQ